MYTYIFRGDVVGTPLHLEKDFPKVGDEDGGGCDETKSVSGLKKNRAFKVPNTPKREELLYKLTNAHRDKKDAKRKKSESTPIFRSGSKTPLSPAMSGGFKVPAPKLSAAAMRLLSTLTPRSSRDAQLRESYSPSIVVGARAGGEAQVRNKNTNSGSITPKALN